MMPPKASPAPPYSAGFREAFFRAIIPMTIAIGPVSPLQKTIPRTPRISEISAVVWFGPFAAVTGGPKLWSCAAGAFCQLASGTRGGFHSSCAGDGVNG
jgi:hypothetical protein